MKVYLHGGKISFWKNPVLALIQFGTDSEYFHVDVEWDSRYGLVVGALWKEGVTVRQLKNLTPQKDCYVHVFECVEPINEQAYRNFLKTKIGLKYDKWGILNLAWLKLKRDHKAANALQKENDYFCSELADKAFRAGGAKLADIPEKSTASPADIARSKSFKQIF